MLDIKEHLASQRLLVVGVARDCGSRIQAELLRLSSALDHFKSVSWLVIESDSSDDTVEVLEKLSATIPHFRFLSLGTLRDEMPLRTQRIAYCRTAYLNELRDNVLYRDTDYVAVADLDGVNYLISSTAVFSCWLRNDWDVCTANQAGPYYDIWALRHKDWSPNDCWRQYWFLRDYGKTDEQARLTSVWSKMITIPEQSEWIEVESAFGGLAIYRRTVLNGVLSYIGITHTGEQVCEHTTLHEQIRQKGGRILINPRLINAAYTRHSKHLLVLALADKQDGFLRCARRVLQGAIKRMVAFVRTILSRTAVGRFGGKISAPKGKSK